MLLNPKIQHLKRRKSKEVIDALLNGEKSFELCSDTPDLSLDVGDVITFQEHDSQGKLTGREVTRKVVYRENVHELRALLSGATEQDLLQHGVAVLGTADVQYRTLRSIYEYAVTFHIAIDVAGGDKGWTTVEGPVAAPLLVAPDLLETGVMSGLHIARWPQGRYSITLMVKIISPELGGPLKIDVVDVMVLTLVKDDTPEQRYGGLMFEELDPIAILDGKTINVHGRAVLPSSIEDVNRIIKEAAEKLKLEEELLDNGSDFYDKIDPTST